MKRFFVAVLLGSVASAQAQTQQLPESTLPPELLQNIARARVEVVAFLPLTRNLDVGEALRKLALSNRPVRLITTPASIRDPRSLTLRLAHTPNVSTYLVSKPGRAFILIDGRIAYSGPALESLYGEGGVIPVKAQSLAVWSNTIVNKGATNRVGLLRLRYQLDKP